MVYSKEQKTEVITKIQGGRMVSEVSKEHGINRQTIYNWIGRSANSSKIGLMEVSRLKRENEALFKLLGRITYEQEVAKKNRYNF